MSSLKERDTRVLAERQPTAPPRLCSDEREAEPIIKAQGLPVHPVDFSDMLRIISQCRDLRNWTTSTNSTPQWSASSLWSGIIPGRALPCAVRKLRHCLFCFLTASQSWSGHGHWREKFCKRDTGSYFPCGCSGTMLDIVRSTFVYQFLKIFCR